MVSFMQDVKSFVTLFLVPHSTFHINFWVWLLTLCIVYSHYLSLQLANIDILYHFPNYWTQHSTPNFSFFCSSTTPFTLHLACVFACNVESLISCICHLYYVSTSNVICNYERSWSLIHLTMCVLYALNFKIWTLLF